ncbi:putative repeat protein (TIGR01451 family)/fimbrial isopeptide formation D2 family protein [Methanobacterium petrolearium]|nr:putative repeat protein (TIGR01451 family)/fimbrial isopeptide formation D2 family protein [Methanobacterium petrolearium]
MLNTVSAVESVDEISNTVLNNSTSLDGVTGLNSEINQTDLDYVNNSGSLQDPSQSPSFSSNSSSSLFNSIISGNVITCTNGSPFPDVTITVTNVDGTQIAQTTTDSNGYYQLSLLSNERSFYVSASYPGHMTSHKLITVEPGVDSSDLNLYGWVNFQLGPEPTLSIDAPKEQFLNESFNFTLTFNNNGNETGFGPTVQLILPPEIRFESANFLGAPVSVTSVGTFPLSGTLIDPLSGLTVTGTPGYQLYVIEYPLGSFTSGQPSAVLEINAFLLGNSTLGSPLDITAYPVFRFGANETGGIPIRGNETSAQVTPTVIKIIKNTASPHEDETATGSNYPWDYTLTVDVADGQTVTAVDVIDNLPGNLQFIQVVDIDGGNLIQQPSTTTPGGLLWITFDSITGVLGSDKTIIYQVYAPKFDNNSQYVLDPDTGAWVNATNSVTVTGNYTDIPVSSQDDYTLTLKPLAIQKSVDDESTDPIQPRPTDILRYTLNFQASDYFSLNNLVLYDILGDGQSFLDSLNYNPRLNLHLSGIDISDLFVDLTNPNQFQYYHNSTTGVTYLMFNITQLLVDNGYTGIVEGGNYTGTNNGATTGNLTFWTMINEYYEGVTPPILHPIVSNDIINNAVIADAVLTHNGSHVEDASGSQVIIVAPTPEKDIIEINGEDPTAPYVIRAGDTVTFSLLIDVPTSNLHDFNLIDYLPIPLLRATQFTTGQAQNTTQTIPSAGQWRLGEDDTLSSLTGVIPTLIVDSAQNTLTFSYGNVYNATQPNATVHILFTITATGDPMTDGLWLTNLLNINYENSPGKIFSDNRIVSLITGEPQLNINKTATPTSDLQAGDMVTYTVTIDNTGNAPAYNVVVTDDLLTSNSGYILSISNITVSYGSGTAITGLNLMDIFTSTGLDFGSLYPIYSANSTNSSIIITYDALLNSTVYPRQVIDNTVNITKYTSLTPPESPNYVGNPAVDQSHLSDSASVQVRDVDFQKNYIGSLDGISSGSNLTIGEIGLFQIAVTLPAGQINDLVIHDILPAGLTYVSHVLELSNFYGNLANLNFTQINNNIEFLFTGLTNTTSNSTFYINITVLMADNSTANPPHTTSRTRTNRATMDWNNPSHSSLTDSATVYLVEPWLTVVKSFNPSTIEGGQTTTVTLQVSNTRSNARSTAYNVIITDSLLGSSYIFDLNSVTEVFTPIGFVFNYDPLTGILTYTGGNITRGQTLYFTFNLTALDTPYIGPIYNNTANATYWSMPWVGGYPDPDSRNYTDSGWAVIRTGDPQITKTVEDSTIHGNTGDLTIGEIVTYKILVTLPQGLKTNLTITDTLPAGFNYNIGEYILNTTGFSGTLGSLSVSSSGQNIIFTFNGITNSTTTNNTFYLLFNTTVLNHTSNINGTVKTNNAALNWTENTRPPFTTSVNTTIVEPFLNVNKNVTPSTVDGGDEVTVTLKVTNTGSSPAYQMELNDVLDTILFNSSTVSLVSSPPGFSFTPGSTVVIKAISGTIINPGDVLTFIFTVLVNDNVPTGSVFQNQADVSFSSMPPGYNDARNYTNTSNIVNINTVSPSVSKTVNSTSEPDSTNPNVLVGEVVTYQLEFIVPEGETFNVSLIDSLMSNLGYNGGTALIKRSDAGIIASGFDFGSSVDEFLTITPTSLSPLSFYLGNVTYLGANGLKNGTITLIFNTTILNIASNQAGTQIPNNATLNFTNATGGSQQVTGTCPTVLNVIVPQIKSTKTANQTTLTDSDTATFSIQIQNNNSTNGAPVYDLIIVDPINGFTMDYLNLSIVPSDPSIIFTNYSTADLIYIVVNKLNPGQYLNITYNATVKHNVTFNSTLNNTVNATGTTLPGPHGTNNATPGDPGTSTGERTGDPTQPAGAVNNINTTATALVTTRTPKISKKVNGTETQDRTIGETATESVILTLPVGSTTELKIIDVLPDGLLLNGGTSGFTYTTTSGVNVNQFVVTHLGGNTYQISFGNVTITQEGNITINYTVLVMDVAGNYNGQNLINSATLYYNNQTGQSVNGGSDTATVHVVEPNLQITKTPSKTDLNIGEEFTYAIQVLHTASSTADAYNLVITDTIPTGLTFVTGSQLCPGWIFTHNGNILTFTRSVLTLADNNSTIFFNCTVNNNYLLAGQNITNAAYLNYTSISTGGRDYTTSNSTQVHVIGADLQVQKNGDSQVNAGEQVTYTITVTNLGPDTAENVTINDIFLTPWFTYLINPQYSLNFGTWTSITTSTWSLILGNMISGSSANIRIRATINASAPAGILNNTVNVTSNTTDPNPNNNNSTATTNVTQTANLTLVKENTPFNIVIAGNNLTYTLTLTNTGPSVARDVTLTDNTFSSYYLNRFYSYSVNGGAWSSWAGFSGPLVLDVTSLFSSGYIGIGETFRVMINGTLNASTPNGTVLFNNATANSSTSPFNTTSNTVNNTVETSAALNVTKSAPESVVAGQSGPVVFTITVTNYGPSDALNVKVSDVLDGRLTGQEYSLNNVDWFVWSSPFAYVFDRVNALETVYFYLRGWVPSDALGLINNTVFVSSNETNLTGNLTDNTTTVINTTSELNVTKFAPESVVAGQSGPVVFTITVTNSGPSDALNVKVSDVLDSRLTGQEYSLDGMSWSAWVNPYEYVFNCVNAAQTVYFYLRGWVPSDALGLINNTVFVSSNETNLTGNLTDNTTTVINTTSELNVTKTSQETVIAGSNSPLVYTITVTNSGPSDALNVKVSDVLDGRLTGQEYSLNNVDWFVWSSPFAYVFDRVNALETVYFYLRGWVPSDALGLINNTVFVSSNETNLTGNLTDNTTTVINTTSELNVTKFAPESVVAGQSGLVVFTITVTNYGPSDAWNVKVSDVLDSRLTGQEYSLDGVSWNAWLAPYEYVFGHINANKTVYIYLCGFVPSNATGLINNTVYVSSNTTNLTGNLTDNTTTVIDTLAILNITKTSQTDGSDVNHIVPGYSIHYTIVVTNEGPSDALNVTFDDYYTPDLLENTYYSTSNGIPWTAYNNPLNLTYLIDRLAPGQNVTIWINGTVISNATQGLNNTAGTSSETDPEGRKTASVYNDVQTSHVTIEKTVSNPQPYIHETIYFTLIVQNWGPDTAINVYVVDKLPDGVKYVSSAANYGSYNPTTGIWTIGNLPYGSIAQLVITVVVEKLGSIENHAHVHTDSYDPILSGHNASASIYVREQPQSGKNSIGMQNTGVPLPSLVLVLFLVLTGLSMVFTRKK